MQIDDILKAAIQDAGLEFFNATTAYSSPANSINSSESSLNQFSLDDDFTLTDLDWNLLDQSEESPVASTSISPASQCSVQSPYNPIQSNTTTPVQVAQTQPPPAEIPCSTIAEDTDPFILALQELDEHNSKLGDQAFSIMTITTIIIIQILAMSIIKLPILTTMKSITKIITSRIQRG